MYESRLGTARISKTPEGATISLPRIWYVFVFGCLVFAVVVATRLVVEFPGVSLFLVGAIGLAALIALYLWVTLHDALSPDDIAAVGVRAPTLRRRLVVLTAMVLLNHAMIPLLPEYGPWWLLAYTMIAAGLVLPLIPAKLVIAGLTVLSMVHAWFFNDVVQPALLMLAVLGFGAIIIRVLTITNVELEASRDGAARLAVAEERLRFARDLHDSLGHTLSTIVLKSELAGRIIDRDAPRAGDEIRDVERVARDALREVRSVVTGYRRPTLAAELDVARETLRAAGIAFSIENQTDQLPPEIESVLAWGIREGVTNVVRHSSARNCNIGITMENGTARMELIDDGRSSTSHVVFHRTGSGLTGLSERIAKAGGWLSAGTRPEGGFQLVLEAPTASEGGAY